MVKFVWKSSAFIRCVDSSSTCRLYETENWRENVILLTAVNFGCCSQDDCDSQYNAKSGVKSLSLQACGVREWGVSLVTLLWDSIALPPCWRALSSSAGECLRVSGLTIAFAVMKQSAEFQALTYDLIAGFNPVVFLSLILFAQWNSRLVQWIRRCCVGSYAPGFDMISVAIESNIRCVLNYWSCAGKPGPLPNWKPISLLFWPRLPWPQRKEEAWRFVIAFRSWLHLLFLPR